MVVGSSAAAEGEAAEGNADDERDRKELLLLALQGLCGVVLDQRKEIRTLALDYIQRGLMLTTSSE